MVHLVVLDRLLRVTTKKGRQLFLRKECTPDKILAMSMAPTSQNLMPLTHVGWPKYAGDIEAVDVLDS